MLATQGSDPFPHKVRRHAANDAKRTLGRCCLDVCSLLVGACETVANGFLIIYKPAFCGLGFAPNKPESARRGVLSFQRLFRSLSLQGTWAAPVAQPAAFRFVRVAKMHGTYSNACTIRVITGPPASPDLALGKPAVASSEFDEYTPAGHGNDGDLGSIWASKLGDPAPWWQVSCQKSLQLKGQHRVASGEGICSCVSGVCY